MDVNSGGIDTNALNKITSLNTGSEEIYNMVDQAFGANGSPADQQKVMAALNERQQKTSLFSNMMRLLYEGKNSIIRNIRA